MLGRGVYRESVAADVSRERLRRFFVKVDGQYQIGRTVRDKCIFAQQNLTKDPPFSKLDLVTCRNVLIYLGPALQARAMRFFHYALNPGGFLVLGQSETVGNANQLFTPIDSKLKIYSRVAGTAAEARQFEFEHHENVTPADRAKPVVPYIALSDTQRRADHYILAHYSPPAVFLDESLNLLQFHGRTSPYLEHGTGEPVLNMNRMPRRELAMEFHKTFDRTRKSRSTVRSGLIRLEHWNPPPIRDHLYRADGGTRR